MLRGTVYVEVEASEGLEGQTDRFVWSIDTNSVETFRSCATTQALNALKPSGRTGVVSFGSIGSPWR